MESTTIKPKIDAITVCVDYSDHLNKILSNKSVLNRWVIVTHKSDIKTIDICKENGLEYILSDRIYSDMSPFAKGKAINEGLKYLCPNDWILQLDSDTLLPSDFKEYIDSYQLNREFIYGCTRIDINGEKVMEMTPDNTPVLDEVIGFFQLWHSSFTTKYSEDSKTASEDDVAHFRKFKNHEYLKIDVVDVSGERCKHHNGRGMVGKRKYLLYGK